MVKRYNELGREGVKDKRQEAYPYMRGKPPLLNEEQLRKLATAMDSKPADGGVWIRPEVARWIEKDPGR